MKWDYVCSAQNTKNIYLKYWCHFLPETRPWKEKKEDGIRCISNDHY